MLKTPCEVVSQESSLDEDFERLCKENPVCQWLEKTLISRASAVSQTSITAAAAVSPVVYRGHAVDRFPTPPAQLFRQLKENKLPSLLDSEHSLQSESQSPKSVSVPDVSPVKDLHQGLKPHKNKDSITLSNSQNCAGVLEELSGNPTVKMGSSKEVQAVKPAAPSTRRRSLRRSSQGPCKKPGNTSKHAKRQTAKEPKLAPKEDAAGTHCENQIADTGIQVKQTDSHKGDVKILEKPSSEEEMQRHTSSGSRSPKKLDHWIICFVADGVIVDGKDRTMSSEGFWRTSKIADRISDDLVVTLNGSKYQLIGLIDSKAARDVGIPRKMITAFRNGFPPNWKELVAKHLGRIKNKPVKGANSSGRREDKKVNNAAEPTPVHSTASLDIHSLPMSRSGRKLVPQLAWWANQRLVVHKKSQEVELIAGTVDMLSPCAKTILEDKRLQRRVSRDVSKSSSSKKKKGVKQKGNSTVSDREVSNSGHNKVEGEPEPPQRERLFEERLTPQEEVSSEEGLNSPLSPLFLPNKHAKRDPMPQEFPCLDQDSEDTDIQNQGRPRYKPRRQRKDPSEQRRGSLAKQAISNCQKMSVMSTPKNTQHPAPLDVLISADRSRCSFVPPDLSSKSLLDRLGADTEEEVLGQTLMCSPIPRHQEEPVADRASCQRKRLKTESPDVPASTSTNALDSGVNAKRKVREEKVKKGQTKRSKATSSKAKRKSPTQNPAPSKSWTSEEIEKLKRSLEGCPVGKSGRWKAISVQVGTRSVQECKDFLQEHPDLDKKPEAKKSKSQPAVTAPSQITAGKGTMKRKRQIRELIEHHEKGHNDNPFEATPFKGIRGLQINNSWLNNSLSFASQANGTSLRTPRPDWMPGSASSSLTSPLAPTPGLLNSVNRDAADRYTNHFNKRKDEPRLRPTQTPTSTRTLQVLSNLDSDPLNESLFKLKEVSEVEDSDEDYYFTDS